uniref:B3 domain-containing protein REM9-like n=1 Tax=Erigeron canadensis TaxID=72917 RepID=UPI001CB99116|nr:B3 domain-containing protein REM9-like [Erigeron canadensis]
MGYRIVGLTGLGSMALSEWVGAAGVCRQPQCRHARTQVTSTYSSPPVPLRKQPFPIDFTKEHVKQILLTVSDNKTWPMHWMLSDNGRLTLQKGWAEFAEHYCIKTGHLLLFIYQGGFTFHVRICDLSSCKINYECFPQGINQSVCMTEKAVSKTSGLSASVMPLCWKPSNFYVYITYDSLYPSSLRMPMEFTSKHGEHILSANVSLIVSNGETWRMDWMISGNGQLWLQKGWPNFKKHYDIKIGHLLFFSYQGNSTFHVQIFDGSNCEINYLLQEIDMLC